MIRAKLACAGLLAALSLPPVALADVDPPSDILLFQNSYVPRAQPPSRPLTGLLAALTDKAHRLGYPIKVAVVGSSADLGAVPQLLDNPSAYATFLGQEIFSATRRRQPLLVVTPRGIGVYQVGREAKSLGGLSVPGGAGSDELTRTAIEAAQRLASAAGYPLGHPKPKAARRSGGTSPAVFFVPVLALAAAGVLVRLRSRRAGSQR